jgi:predicted RNA-binding protein (virulence factor B family)
MDLKVGDKVDLLVVRNTGLGFTVLVDGAYEGLLVGYVKKIRDDEKIDVSLQAVGFKQTIVKNEIIILNALKKQDGFIGLNDKSSPDEIKYQLNMSKKAFKNAVGGLFKQKLITIEDDGIKLVQ